MKVEILCDLCHAMFLGEEDLLDSLFDVFCPSCTLSDEEIEELI